MDNKNKETLQNYNNMLGENNTALDAILETINNLPEAGSGEPEVGYYLMDFNENGLPTKVKINGYEFTPDNAFYKNILSQEIIEVVLSDDVREIGDYCFYGCDKLKKINLASLPNRIHVRAHAFEGCSSLELKEFPQLMTDIWNADSAFKGCSSITIKSLPFGTINGYSSFEGCTSITQLSMDVKNIVGNGTSQGAFKNCTGLKAIWCGSKASSFGRYAFGGCTALKKMYIDLPRATVEAMSNYSYAWSSTSTSTQSFTTDIIICNDDEGFMTQEEFDAIDWSNYTE